MVGRPILSVQLYSLRAIADPATRLRLVAGSGLSHVETTTRDYDDARTTRRLLDAHGISAPSGHFGIEPLREHLDWVVETAKVLGLGLAVLWGFPEDEHWTDPAGWARAGAELGRIADRLYDAGLAFAYHNHDWELRRFGDGRLALDVLFDAAAGSALRFQPDLAWLVRGGIDPKTVLSRHSGNVVACHVKDLAPPGGNPQEEGWANLGEGILVWEELWPAALKAGAGLMVLEHDAPADPSRFLARSAATARRLAASYAARS